MVLALAISDYLEMEQRWPALARSYEFAERLSSFTAAKAGPRVQKKKAPPERG
jgi:hypothetical protein